ncbi:MAG TPA: TAT-variant-translocated molybdopterin oxidoreductase [Terriglobales bacterium]|nr:TAT-variant-translocated molybdopterin oxidoreductase [Terriglobales bacterium]
MELIQIKNTGKPKLDLETVQKQLSAAQGPEYWRSLEELAGTDEFQELLHREFPRQASEWIGDETSRRGFLKLMSASLALAGLSGCTRMPTQAIVPYVKQPEELVLGRPLFFASAFTLGAEAIPVLVRSHEGRPTKIEGNPEHPASRGRTDSFAQGSILDLYDPDRSQTNMYRGETRAYGSFIAAMQAPLASQKANGGAGFRLLTRTVNSPTLAAQIRTLQQKFPQMKWVQWDPVNRDAVYAGAQLAFGEPVETRYQFANADVVVTLDADFLYSGFPGMAMYSMDWANRRDPDEKVNPHGLSRMYAIESSPTTTGFKADHRIPVKPSEVEQYARALASRLGVGSGGSVHGEHNSWLDAVAKDLQAHRGRAVVVAGENQPAAVHALAHAMNEALGAVGSTVIYTEPLIPNTASATAGFKELVGDITAGKVDFLLILDGNPVYECPVDSDFQEVLKKVPLKVHYGLHYDETAYVCDWHIIGTHFLEHWSDARAADGVVSIVQPLIAPLYSGHSPHEILALMNGQPDVTGYDLVRTYWQTQFKGTGTFDDFWRRSIHDGFIAGSDLATKNVKVRTRDFPATQVNQSQGTEMAIRRDPSIYDGRFANNGWLQELPKPLTKLTWDNAIMVSPKMAKDMGFPADQDAAVAEVEYRGRKIEGPVWVQPGHPDDTITMYLGYGRLRGGQTATGHGFNAYTMWYSDEPFYSRGVKVTKTGKKYPLASTQGTQVLNGRNIVRAAKLEEYKRNPEFAHEHAESPKPDETLIPNYQYPAVGENGAPEHKWGMSIDLNRCTGCNACIIACVAENNTPVVGKDQVLRGRHMHWLRVDGYYKGGAANPQMYYEPVPCMHCETAPCELVCPVGATVHSSEGLNDMVYNRCVGTRYCSNNCPYKVRRFNFLLFQDWTTPQLKMMRNPEVTVRSRGVMEKCTYCVQRITNGRIVAERDDRRVRDGDVLTACQQVCPTDAIIFGDINDPNSRVAKLKADPRTYGVLEDLNTRPRTTYTAAVLNPNPEIEGGEPEQHHS